ncbi:Sjogren's syndrome/scleroderma autoantigen 1 family protein [Haloplanus sp.]|uniref:Sjogren's syndrome/scleroderma autoantigen 1 family protein n=1 Tax=Haloplanus sp. TaxID=1961696 RepID=UPI00262C623B|nr:Sjogren's syndrome/scleroderma autoantigen 1 family protein [Haloplanus sp.]
MSGFDKEAERERLREKYERDQEKRAATQRMSELLLKGATMTNNHCDTCGDPIFRHDGQAFCPTCQAEGDTVDAATTDTDTQTGTDSASVSASAPTAEATDHEPATPDGPTPDADADSDADTSRRAPSNVDAERSPVRPDDARDRVPVDGNGDVSAAQTTDSRPDATVETARGSLSRTLVRYARAAEDADDPARAAELLGAAREAAETLAALEPVR